MSDAMRAAGLVGGSGVAGAILLMTWRVYNDARMAWAVVLSGLVVLVLLALAVVLFLARQAMESRIVLLSRTQEERLLAARVARTWPGGQEHGGGGGLLGQLLAGQPGHDVIDTGLTWRQAPDATRED